ncbi:MAG: hypothetical protein AB8B86_13770 [Pseudomonadales bacterium]
MAPNLDDTFYKVIGGPNDEGAIIVSQLDDAVEPLRRMCKWIFEEECKPDELFPLWRSE